MISSFKIFFSLGELTGDIMEVEIMFGSKEVGGRQGKDAVKLWFGGWIDVNSIQ